MRTGFIVLWMLLCSITSAAAQVSVGIGIPGVSIGINVPVYPQLVLVPGYPVYYAPQVTSNYFFYDGMYWVYAGDNWYTSTWYNGPWEVVTPEAVPLFVLRVPVRYYRRPPAYFHGWSSNAPPRWGEHWGDAWAQRRSGWDNWSRGTAPAPAPLPVYQRQYSANRYPRAAQQPVLQAQNYRYQPHDAAVQQHYQSQAPRVQSAPVPSQQARQAAPKERPASRQQQRGYAEPSSVQQGAAPVAHAQSQQRAVQHEQKPTTSQVQNNGPQSKPAQEPRAQRPPQQLQQAAAQHQQQVPQAQGHDGPQGKAPAQEPKQRQEKSRDQGEQQGGEHDK